MSEVGFQEQLVSAGFNIKKDNDNGILFTSYLKEKPNTLSAHEIFALENAQRLKATAVYFRYFSESRKEIPQAYIYDNSKNEYSGDLIGDLHKKLWSSCIVPLYLIFEKTQIKIFDARKPAKQFDDKLTVEPFEVFKTVSEVKKLLVNQLHTGVFWESELNNERFNYSTSAYTDLITGLKKVYLDFREKSNLPKDIAIRLLVQSLLIKYLEERDEEEPSGLFAKTFFKTNFKCENFCDVIRSGKLMELLDKLAKHFNGKIFEWDNQNERKIIQGASVKKLAFYLDGNNIENHYVIWRLYSFSHLPVELISSVYEELLSEGKKDMVYTPDIVASLLVDECMPLNKPREIFKIIDISCGSGIFLVKSYKRIIQWWRLQNRDESGLLPRPDKETLKTLLSKSIYGVDIQNEATLLTIFSLSLALCDELKPIEIWTKLKFKNLSTTNIIAVDFFKYITESPESDFDLVIGNVPFNPPFNKSNGEYKKELKEQYNFEPNIKVPDHNIGLTMLYESLKLLKEKGQLCLIQPAGPLLYQKDIAFKRKIFGEFNLQQIIDFTFLVDKLWNKATVSTVAVFIQKTSPDTNKVAHIVLHRTKTNVNKLYFELDHYDFHFISKYDAISNPFIWKANLVGGSRLIPLIKRFSELRTVGQFLDIKEKDGWKIGEGFIEVGKKNHADYITGQKYLPTEAFRENGIKWDQVKKCEIEHFHNPRNKYIYSPPHILLKENIGERKLITYYSNDYLVFRDKIIGIYAPKHQEKELKSLYYYFENYSDIIRAYIITTSSQLIVGMNTAILKKDFMQCPYPERLEELEISDLEKAIIKEINYHYNNATQKNKLETLKADIPHLLNEYSKTFCGIMNSIYQTNKYRFVLSNITNSDSYYSLQFDYTDNQVAVEFLTNKEIEDSFDELIIHDNFDDHGKVKIQRILKFYSKDRVVFVKPKNFRYWMNLNAAKDADETIIDYLKSGF